ncbi:recombinase family protein [Paenibacillus sp. FSL F4-0122]|uniref:recombinase family protein n=2 Tax=unclassified Paenibacillus TaxID=185978 RepID=UPI0030FBCA5D
MVNPVFLSIMLRSVTVTDLSLMGWSNITVQLLLASEIHLVGYITYGKSRSKRGQVELVPEEERIKVMGTHEKLKTLEEHEAIMKRLLKNRMLNPNSRRNIFPLSGLFYFEKCGSRMRFRVGKNKKQGQHLSALCYHKYKDGSKSERRGKVMDAEFFNALYDRIIHIDPNILREIEMHGSRYNDTQVIIEVKAQDFKKQKRALDKLHESYEEDMITKQVFLERKAVRSRQIQKLEEELKDLRKVVVDEGNYPTVE